MSSSTRTLVPVEATAACTQVNLRRLDALKIKAGLIVHADATPAIATPNAADLPTSIALITQLQVTYTAHIGSACDATTGIGVHMAADGTEVLSAAVPTDLASCESAVNEVKTQYNLHRALTTSHPVADSTNAVSTAAATDLTTTIALANALKTAINAHMAMAMNSQAIAFTAP